MYKGVLYKKHLKVYNRVCTDWVSSEYNFYRFKKKMKTKWWCFKASETLRAKKPYACKIALTLKEAEETKKI